jgi:hypothetical protein
MDIDKNLLCNTCYNNIFYSIEETKSISVEISVDKLFMI